MAADRPRWLLIAFIALSQFASAFMHAIVGVPLPTMAREFGASGLELSLLDTVFLGAAAALLMPIGRFADVTDKNSLFKWGLVALGIATFAIGLQPTMPLVIVCRFLQAVAAAFLIATSMALVADIAPRDQLGRMVGLAIGATYMGLASGPYFAGLVTTHLGWRWVFFLAAVPPLAAYALSRITLPSRWKPPSAPVNLVNSALLVVAIATLIAGSATLGRGPLGYILLAAAVIAGAVYFAAEKRSSNPLLNLRALGANRRLSQALLVQFLIYCGTVGTTFLLSIYLQVIQGHTPEGAGQILIVGPVVMAVFAPFGGRLADRFPPHLITFMGGTFILCQTVLAAFLDAGSGLVHVLAVMVFQGLGFAFFSAPNISNIMTSVVPAERGMASALSAEMRSLGMMVSMAIVTVLISVRLGTAAVSSVPDRFLSVMTLVFVAFSILTALGVIASLKKPPSAAA